MVDLPSATNISWSHKNLRKEAKVAIAVAVPIIIGGIAYLIYKVQATRQKYLQISAGEGGTTDPAPGPHQYNLGENVTVTALPNADYTVGTWVVDGVEVARNVSSIAVTMDADHTVIVTFWKGGQPPPSYPVSIIPLGSVNVLQNAGVYPAQLGYKGKISIKHYKDDWSVEGYAMVPMRFKVVDAAGNGVPDVDVALWSEGVDGSRYRGVATLEGFPHLYENPIIVKTDADGVATVHVGYMYGLNDQFKQLVKDAGVGATTVCLIYPLGFTVYDGVGVCNICGIIPCWGLSEWHGECWPGKPECSMPIAWPNKVYANVVGTALTIPESANCSFYIKWVS